MSTASQEILKSFEHLPEPEQREVASEIIRRTFALDRVEELDDEQLAKLYAEFSHADRQLAEDGMGDYERGLAREDAG